ncbi:MAG: hypothetical protein ABSF47_00290 [Minisyncoccia bacterium]|jgi:hypothetical protein
MNQVRFFLLALVLAIVAIPASAQMMHPLLSTDSSYLEQFRNKTPDEVQGKVWGSICAMNRMQYPDSNKVMPGDFIAMPLGEYYQATAGGTSHMWDAARCFTNKIVLPYLNGTLETRVQQQSKSIVEDSTKASSRPYPEWLVFFPIVIIVLAALYFLARSKKWNKKPVNPPFISSEKIPNPKTATPEQVRPLVQEALGGTFGEKNFKLIGDTEDVLIEKGTLVSFFKDGSHTVKEYKNQDGYRALVEFLRSGKRSLVVLDAACFNPLWTAEYAEFSGTVIPKGKTQPEVIERITMDQVGDIGENIRRINRGEEVAVEPVVEQPPAAPAQESPTAQEPPTSEEKEPEVSVEEIQISEGRLTLKGGRVKLSFDQLKELIHEVVPKGGASS